MHMVSVHMGCSSRTGREKKIALDQALKLRFLHVMFGQVGHGEAFCLIRTITAKQRFGRRLHTQRSHLQFLRFCFFFFFSLSLSSPLLAAAALAAVLAWLSLSLSPIDQQPISRSSDKATAWWCSQKGELMSVRQLSLAKLIADAAKRSVSRQWIAAATCAGARVNLIASPPAAARRGRR